MKPTAAKPTVAIIYGFAEGPLLGRKLRAALQAQGFAHTKDVRQADIIIAHSGGALLVPEDAKANAVLLVAPPVVWRDSMWATMQQKVKLDREHARRTGQLRQWFTKSAGNSLYIASGLGRARHMFRKLDRQALPALRAQNVGVIAFRGDPWSENIGRAGLHHKHSYTFVSYDRIHDDLWIHPEAYISVLQYLHAG